MATATKDSVRTVGRKAQPKVAHPARKRIPVKKVAVPASGAVKKFHSGHGLMSFGNLVKLNLADLHLRVKGGLPPTTVDQGAEYLGVSKNEFIKVLHISNSTLSRWSRENMAMPVAESDRVARVARITLLVEEALGNREDAVEWLNSRIPALGNVKPLELLGSDSGVKMVEDVLVRAQAGVYG